jgi:hypothetical protein
VLLEQHLSLALFAIPQFDCKDVDNISTPDKALFECLNMVASGCIRLSDENAPRRTVADQNRGVVVAVHFSVAA